MARKKPDWEKARALFEAGKSYREIEKETFIDASNIAKKAKKEDWQKDFLPALIKDTVRVTRDFTTLSTTQRDVVTTEVNKQLEGLQFYETEARKVAKVAVKILKSEPSIIGAKTAMATLKEGMIVEGLVPFYPNSTTINNTNAQQTNPNPINFSIDPFEAAKEYQRYVDGK